MILMGNAGAGKSTMARLMADNGRIPLLSLDEIAWNDGIQRIPFDESVQLLHEFIATNDEWIIEGCYGDLIEAAIPACTELRFLNPAVETCVANCQSRPFEPEKWASPKEQQAHLAQLIEWVRTYESRNDEFGLARHRRIFDSHQGVKREYTRLADFDSL